MKIVIDLTDMDNEGGARRGRVLATALLSALPIDKAELAVVIWRGGAEAETRDAAVVVETSLRDEARNSVDVLELSIRSARCLETAEIFTLGDLVGKTEYDRLRIPNLGLRSLNEIKERLDGVGLSLLPRLYP